jgi:hypothetical protein
MIADISSRPESSRLDFFEYCDSLGFFDNIQLILPSQFFIIFEIARVLFTPELKPDSLRAVDELLSEEKIRTPNRDESILINRIDRTSPLSDNMEISRFQTIYDLKKTLPKELALDDDIFDIKLLTKSLQVQRFYESESDQFKPISTTLDKSGREANRFEQKFFLLLDKSRSMDFKMRFFFSKCLVAEFLRRKLNSNAKIYYRPFDSRVYDLFKIEKKEDFPFLIENILLTTTGGRSTNLQEAIIQAIKDIHYDKDMTSAEILVVTDCISKIDKYKIQKVLGDIKLNILKIGRDLAEPDFFEKQKALKSKSINIDLSKVDIDDIRKKISDSDSGLKPLSPSIKRAFKYILDHSEKMFQDLRDISHRFIEIQDLDSSELFKLTDENLDFIGTSIDEFSKVDFTAIPLEELMRTYKQAYFLNQYIELLMQHGDNEKNPLLQNDHERLKEIRHRMLQHSALLQIITQTKGFDEEKKVLKRAQREAKKKRKEMIMLNRSLSKEEMKEAQLLMTFDIGQGNLGQVLRLLLMKLWKFLRGIFK